MIVVEKTWRYTLEHEYKRYFPEIKGVFFTAPYCLISAGWVTIPKGYAWNGCDPAYKLTSPLLRQSLWVSTPNGPTLPNGLPQTWTASLVHDAMCQYRGQIPNLTKEQTVQVFHNLLIECGFGEIRSSMYAAAVNYLGPQIWD